MWLHSSAGRVSHRYRGGHGFEPVCFVFASCLRLVNVITFARSFGLTYWRWHFHEYNSIWMENNEGHSNIQIWRWERSKQLSPNFSPSLDLQSNGTSNSITACIISYQTQSPIDLSVRIPKEAFYRNCRCVLCRSYLRTNWQTDDFTLASEAESESKAQGALRFSVNQKSEAESEARRNRSRKDQKSFFFFRFRFCFRRFRSSENRVNGIESGIISQSKNSLQGPFKLRGRKKWRP